MIERRRLQQQEEQPRREKAEANRLKLTKAVIDRRECPAVGQQVIWDKEQKGLSVLMSKSVKSFRATYRLRGRTLTTVIGRVGEMDLDEARDTVSQYRRDARKGIDPKGPKPGEKTFEQVVDDFIEKYAKPNQRRWYQVQGVLKRCTPLLKRPFDAIELAEVMTMLDDLAVKKKHPYAASVALSHLKTLWKWAKSRGFVKATIFVDVTSDFERRRRNRVYSDDEIKRIWKAAEAMPSPVETAYYKVLLLLAPRISSLAWMRRSHMTFDDKSNPTLWTVPYELTKSTKRVKDPTAEPRIYHVPLPSMVQRILKPLLSKAQQPDDLVFPGLPIRRTKDQGFDMLTHRLTRHLINGGAPKDFFAHAFRHTMASWFKVNGASEYERSLLLNHSSSSVTEGYSHGTPHKLKLELLERWAVHVEALITPAEGVAVLR
jgi:integrase